MDYAIIEKLKWRSRRSMLELDLYFELFIQSGYLNHLSSAELVDYQHILDLDDSDLLLLFQSKQKLLNENQQKLIEEIIGARHA